MTNKDDVSEFIRHRLEAIRVEDRLSELLNKAARSEYLHNLKPADRLTGAASKYGAFHVWKLVVCQCLIVTGMARIADGRRDRANAVSIVFPTRCPGEKGNEVFNYPRSMPF